MTCAGFGPDASNASAVVSAISANITSCASERASDAFSTSNEKICSIDASDVAREVIVEGRAGLVRAGERHLLAAQRSHERDVQLAVPDRVRARQDGAQRGGGQHRQRDSGDGAPVQRRRARRPQPVPALAAIEPERAARQPQPAADERRPLEPHDPAQQQDEEQIDRDRRRHQHREVAEAAFAARG